MKKSFFLSCALLFLLISFSNTAKANMAAGGELIYVHIADSTYSIFLKLYRDCSGSAEPDSVPLCFYNPCTNVTTSFKMGKFTGSTPPSINTGCSKYKTTCDSPGSNIPGYKEHWYTVVVTMPSRCNAWKMYTFVNNRNNSNNLQNSSSKPLYVEATMNNTISHINSSPYYSVKAMPYVGQNIQFTYNNGAIDADGDSLWTDIIMPQSGVNNCGDTAVNMIFNTVTPPYNLSTNPFQTNNTFVKNGNSGQITFTSTDTGQANITFRTREYRNGVLIGSVMRDMQVQTLNVPPRPLYTTAVNCLPSNSSTFPNQSIQYACPGVLHTFCFNITSPDTNARIVIQDNFTVSIPGSYVTYYGQGTDSVHAIFYWTPTMNDIGNHSGLFIITDSTCYFPGLLHQDVEYIDFVVWGPVEASRDTTICAGQPIFLGVTGGANYIWTALPGGTANLSNPNIANPVAFPTKTTTYVVTSTITPHCPALNKDTVVVTVRPQTQGASIITNTFGCGLSNPGINYMYSCPGQPISFCFNSASQDTNALLYLSNDKATSLPGANISYTNQGTDSVSGTFSWTPGPNDVGLHSVTLAAFDSACAPAGVSRTKLQRLDFFIWPATTTGTDAFICPGDSVQISASGGVQYQWSVISGRSNSLSNPNSATPWAKPDTTTTYIVTSTINNLCGNNKDTVTVWVHPSSSIPSPRVSISVTDSTITMGDLVTFTATATNCNKISYRWYVNGTQVSGVYTNTFTTSNLLNLDKVHCMVACADSCTNPKDTISNIITMQVNLPTNGVTDIESGNQISIYPNPNNGTFTITLNELSLAKNAKVNIYNIYGQSVHTTNIHNKTQQISLQNLPAGIYTIRVVDGVNVVSKSFVVK